MAQALLLLGVAAAAAATIEPRTGISFPEKHKGGSLAKLGVRYKGPIKVYAVGEYDTGTFMLKMSYGVGAKKMVNALGDALKPRCNDAKLIEEFEECLTKGLPNGAPKGTVLEFATGGSKLGVTINSKPCGAIGSKALCAAFANIYTDKSAVCSLAPVGADGEAESSSTSCCSPPPAAAGALIGAAVGYVVGKVVS